MSLIDGVVPLELLFRAPAEAGDAPRRETPLLFVHGAFVGAWCWDEHFLPWFAEQGYPVAAVSLRGHGGSGGQDRLHDWSIADYVADVAAAVRWLEAQGYPPPIVIGHSMGGFVLQHYLAQGPAQGRAQGAILLAPVPPGGLAGPTLSLMLFDPRTFWQINAIQSFGATTASATTLHAAMFTDDVPRAVSERHFSRMAEESRRATLEMNGGALPDVGAVKARNLPMLILQGKRDTLIPPAYAAAAADRYGARMEVFDDLAHGLMLDPQWRRVAVAMADWLADWQADRKV